MKDNSSSLRQRGLGKRLHELRSEGRAPRSPELGTSIGLLAGCVILQMAAPTAAPMKTSRKCGSYPRTRTRVRGATANSSSPGGR